MNISKPTLLVDFDKIDKNIARIAAKGALSNTQLIPHFKTHQSHRIGEAFKKYGVSGITVSSVSMANYFTQAGWNRIYVAFPVNILEIEDINNLAERVELTLLVNNVEQLQAIITAVEHPVQVKVEIECGSDRSGVNPNNTTVINAILQHLSGSKHHFDGFYSHFGHTYKSESPQEVMATFNTSIKILSQLKEQFAHETVKLSTGDTPSASVMEKFDELYSVHAGNYVFYDLTQAQIGVCSENDIAIVLAAPVVDKNYDKKELVLYGGGIHLSKESLYSREFDRPIYGKLVKITAEGWSESLRGCYVRSISQEHGIAVVNDQVLKETKIGDIVGILPVHSCMTADCMRQYFDSEGNKIDHFQGLAKS